MRRHRLSVLLAALLLAPGCEHSDAPPPAIHGFDIVLDPEREVVEARVPRNATLAGLLRAHHLSEALIATVVEAANGVFDLRRIRAENPYRLVKLLDGGLQQFTYHIDRDSFLRILLEGGMSVDVEVVPYAKERALVAMRGGIDQRRTSLVAALEQAGEHVPLAMSLAEALGGEIDFNHDLQPGDSFQVLFEKVLVEDADAGYGDVLAVEFENDGRVVEAFRYTQPGGKPGFYDAEGRSLRRQFLRSPLRFEPRVTSRFSRRRMHPILGEYRAHLGVDYGAPQGSAVVAVADGTVVSAGWSGGSGRMVRLRHAGGYETYYLHLSSIPAGIRRGARVAQGQLVGRVGATGLATGPHLDYRLKRDNTFVDPLVAHRQMPPGEPISAENLADFGAVRDRFRQLFIGRPSAPGAIAADE